MARAAVGAASLRVVARVLGSAAQAGTLVLLARLAGASMFGTIAVVLAVASIVLVVASFGSSTRVLRIRAERPDHEARAASYLRAQLLGTAAAALVCGVCLVIFDDGSAVLIAATWVVLDGVAGFAQAHAAGFGRHRLSSLLVLVQRGVPLAGCVLAVSLGGSWEPVVIASLVAATVACAVPLATVWRGGSLRMATRGAAGYWLAAVGSNVGQLELPLVRSLLSAQQFGIFAIAARTANPFTIVGAALQTVFVPELATAIGTSRFSRTFWGLLGVSVGYACLIAAAAPAIGRFLVEMLGDSFAGAEVLVSVFIACMGLVTISQALQARLLALGKPAASAFAVLGGVSVGLVYDVIVLAFVSDSLLWTCPIVMQSTVLAFMVVASRRHRHALRPLPDASRPDSASDAGTRSASGTDGLS